MATSNTEKPKGNIQDLQNQVSSIFVSNSSLTKEQAKRVNEHIFAIAKKAGVDGAAFKVYPSETGAVLRMMVDKGMLGEARADKSGLNGLKTVFGCNGVSKNDMLNDAYLRVLAGTAVTAFAMKSGDLTGEQKSNIAQNIRTQIKGSFEKHSDWETYYNSCTNQDSIDKARNPTCRGYVADKALRVGLGVISFSGLVASIKAAFNPPENTSFWNRIGNIAKAAGFAFVAYNMVYQGRGVGETIDNTKETVRDWAGYVTKRREQAQTVPFSRVPSA